MIDKKKLYNKIEKLKILNRLINRLQRFLSQLCRSNSETGFMILVQRCWKYLLQQLSSRTGLA